MRKNIFSQTVYVAVVSKSKRSRLVQIEGLTIQRLLAERILFIAALFFPSHMELAVCSIEAYPKGFIHPTIEVSSSAPKLPLAIPSHVMC